MFTENAARLRRLLAGLGSDAEQDIVILNTAALLFAAGKSASLKEGAEFPGMRSPHDALNEFWTLILRLAVAEGVLAEIVRRKRS